MTAIGSRVERPDGLEKVMGSARYTADLTLPGTLHARLVYPTLWPAKITTIDVTRARELPGVHAVLTQDDLPLERFGMVIQDRTLLAHDEVRFEGDAVAVVAAESEEIAIHASELVEVEYERLEPLADPEQALAEGAPLVHSSWEQYTTLPGVLRDGNGCGYCTIEKGDAETALASADIVVTSTARSDMTHPVPIEPRAILAEWRGEKVTVWSTSQVPHVARAGVAATLQMPERNVRVIVPHLGGGFGGKCDLHYEPHVAALARATGRPVRLVFDRYQEFMAPDMRNHPMRMEFTTGLTSDGTIVARKARLVLDTGAYAGHGPVISEMATMMAAGPYRIPNIFIEAHTVYTYTGPSSSVRAPSGPQAVWAAEQHIDVCAERVGLDPIDFRMRNLVEDGDEGPTGQVFEAVSAKECLSEAITLLDAPDDLPEDEGVGVAVGWWYSLPMASAATVRLNADGSATVITGAQENGSGAVMGLALLAAEELGIDPSEVSLVYQDTDAGGRDHGSAASQTTFNNGRAVVGAARKIRDRLLELAAKEFEADVADLEIHEGTIRPKGVPSKAVSFADLAMNANYAGEQLVFSESPLPPPAPENAAAATCAGRVFFSAFQAPSFFANAVRVKVDRETGVVRVLDIAAVHDFGRVINPPGAEGQVEGGVVHGIGIALLEGAQHDERGTQINSSLLGYKLQTSADVPAIKLSLLEHPASDGGPHGLKAVGEPPIVAAPGAIGNAITHATGARLELLPMTPERVWRVLNQQDGQN